MIVSYVLSRIDDEDMKEQLVCGLVCGLFCGLAGGLVCGLAGGLFCGLVFGLVCGLVCGLAGGLFCGLVFGLVCGLVFGLVFGLVEIYTLFIEWFIVLLIGVLVVSEILYWVDKHKWDDLGRWGNTLLKKAESLFESSVVIVNGLNVLLHGGDVVGFFSDNKSMVMDGFSYVGVGCLVVLVIGVFVWLNSFKFKDR